MTVLEGLAAGTIDLVFRRWSKQNVRPGDVLRLEAGVIEVDSVEIVDPATIADADARRAGADSANAVRGTLRGPADAPVCRVRLRCLGPDPRQTLSAEAELSEKDFEAIRERLSKKGLGPTHGLEVGYRISPRGAAYLRLTEDPGRTR